MNEEQSTIVDIACLVTEWKAKGKNTLSPMTVDSHFLEHHKTQYLDLHSELQKIEYSQHSEAALQNFKTLLLLEIVLLLGCNVEWAAAPSLTGTQNSGDPPVLSQSVGDADADESADDGGNSGEVAPAAAATATATPQRARATPPRV